MQQYVFEAVSRHVNGKGANRRLRHDNKVPAILYGGDTQTPLTFELRALTHAFHNESVFSSIVNIVIDGNTIPAVIKEVQRHPASDAIMHVDFQRIDSNQPINVHVPLHFLGEDKSNAIKMGGQLIKHLVSIEVRCLPSQLPEYLSIDISNMGIGDTLHLSDIPLPNDVVITALTHGDDQSYNQSICYIAKSRLTRTSGDNRADADGDESGDAEQDS